MGATAALHQAYLDATNQELVGVREEGFVNIGKRRVPLCVVKVKQKPNLGRELIQTAEYADCGSPSTCPVIVTLPCGEERRFFNIWRAFHELGLSNSQVLKTRITAATTGRATFRARGEEYALRFDGLQPRRYAAR